jgi:YggT family protein
MMTDSLTSAGLFLVNTIFDLYLLVLMARVILAWVHADYFNPLTQIIIKLTQPIVGPLRRVIPNYAGIEFSTLLVIFALEMLKFLFIGMLAFGLPTNVFGLMVLAGADMVKLLLNTFFYAIFLQAILSWIQPGPSPITRTLMQITSPVIRPIQRLMPPVSGFDLSPIPALIILQLLIIVLVNPMYDIGMRMTFS